jgi:hypothetical protein
MTATKQRLEVDTQGTMDGMSVTIELNNLGLHEGSKLKLERLFFGRKDTVRFRAAYYIRAARRAWRNGTLLELMEP